MTDIYYREELLAQVAKLAMMAYAEDIPINDATADLLFSSSQKVKARIIAREPMVMAGEIILPTIINSFFKTAADNKSQCEIPTFNILIKDGTYINGKMPQTIIELNGSAPAIVSLERSLLNFLNRAIGIATATYAYVKKVSDLGYKTQILDTRKTQPAYRYFDKYAVLCGGGVNHRMDLSQQILLKENHVHKLGGVATAINKAQEAAGGKDFICEVRNIEEAKIALSLSCPIIMLDNFTPAMVMEVCSQSRKNSQIEVSGGINLKNIHEYLHSHLDRISIGAITHSVIAPDISLLMEEL